MFSSFVMLGLGPSIHELFLRCKNKNSWMVSLR